MPDLDFSIESVEVVRHAATPSLNFRLRVASAAGHAIANVALHCQIQIEAPKRRYDAAEQPGLRELFGAPERYGQTVKTMLWAHANVLIPGFENQCIVDLPIPCSFDFNVVATKYFHALKGGEVPLSFQFSGSVFYRDAQDLLQVGQIAWTREASFRLPVATWHAMMDHYYPDSAWLCVSRGAFESLDAYRLQNGLHTRELALEHALRAARKAAVEDVQ